MAKNPSLYITNYFYSIRNDIDIAAEVLLISSEENNEQNEQPVDCEPNEETYESYWSEERKLLPYSDEVKRPINANQINEMRDLMVAELKPLEQSCIKNVELLNESDYFKANDKCSSYETELGAIFNPKIHNVIDELSFKTLQAKCENLHIKLDKDTDELKKTLLMNMTIFFRKAVLNHLGILVIFEDNYLKDVEVEFLK